MSIVAALVVLRTLAALERVEPGEGDPPALTASEATIVETHWSETGLRVRPWIPSKRVATLARGARLIVRGQVASRDNGGCHGKPWYAVYPYGYVCSEHVRRSKAAPAVGSALPLAKDRRLPYDYVLTRGDDLPMYASAADVLAGKICEASCDRFRTISIFGDTMNGNTEPLSLLGGPAQSGMLDASAMVYDPGEKTVLVADFYGQSIHVFPAAARGAGPPAANRCAEGARTRTAAR